MAVTYNLKGTTNSSFQIGKKGVVLTPADNTSATTVTFPNATGTAALLESTQTFTGAITFDASGNSVLVSDTLRIAQSGSGLRMTNVGAFDNDGSDNFRIYGTNNLYLRANGENGSGLSIDSTNQDVTVDNDLIVGGNLTVQGTTTTVDSTTVNVQNAFVFEGTTADDFETTLTVTDPTADRTITLPNATGTVALTSDLTSYITASSSDTLTNKSGNISQWTNNAGYLTSTNINTSTSGSNALITLTNSAGGSDSVTLAAGSNITISESGDTITIASTASGSALTIQDEGSTLTTDATTLNFVGAGVTASGSGSTKTITISGGSSYTDSDVNTHLNTSTASSGEVLSWNGSDYDWVAQSGGGSSLTIQDEGSTLTTDATTLNFVGAGVTASGSGSTKTITISGGASTIGALSAVTITSPALNQVLKYNGSAWVNAADATGSGSADLGAVAEDILPSFDEIYDIGSSTYKWYDGYFTNSINLDTIALTNSSGTLSINSDVIVGSLLVDSLLLSENTITADASTALQYLGDKGVVEINNSNLDVREGDWIGVPVVETTNVVTSSSSSSSSVVDTTYASSTDYSYAYFDSFQNRIEIEADTGFNEAFGTKLLNLVAGDEIIFNYYNAVDDEYGGPVTLTLSATPTYQASPKRYFIPYSSVSPSVSGMAPDVLNISISETVITTTTTNTTTAVPPLTTGSEGIIRYNKDEGRFEGYNAEGWASLGGLEKDADGNNTVAGNLIVSGDITSTSDKTLKDNIKSIEGALDIVTKLSGKMFTMKSDETQKEKVGFIAQEIEQHLPQVVSTDPNGIKSVSYGNVAALLVEAIKELNQKIEDLKK